MFSKCSPTEKWSPNAKALYIRDGRLVYDIGWLGNFSMKVNPTTLKPEFASVTPNPDFGRLITSYSQEGVDSRRAIRLRLRLTF